MYQVLQAVCRDGQLVLSEKLGTDLEGKRLNIIVLDVDEFERKRKRFFEFVDQHAITLPADYHFDRDDLYER